MPTIEHTKLVERYDHYVTQWTPLANGDSGDPLSVAGAGDRTIQVAGTFGSGGTVLIEGTVDGTNWLTLTDFSGTALSLTSAAIKSILQNTVSIRPRVSAGDVSTAITVTACVLRAR